jgi:hypothetical protein
MTERIEDPAMTTSPISRRGFIASSSFAALTCGSRAIATPRGQTKPRYIDIHTHLGDFYFGRLLTAELLVRFMDQHDVEMACVLPLISPESAPITQPVTTAIAAYHEFPDRIIPFASLDPRAVTEPGKRTDHVAGVKGMVDILKRYQDVGTRLNTTTASGWHLKCELAVNFWPEFR